MSTQEVRSNDATEVRSSQVSIWSSRWLSFLSRMLTAQKTSTPDSDGASTPTG